MKKSKKNKQLGLAGVMAVSIILGIVLGILAAKYLPEILNINEFLAIFLCIIAAYVQIVIHEAGHLVFGLVSGYKFSSFRIGNIMIAKYGNKMKVKFFKIPGTGGQCIMIPPDLKKDKMPFVLYGYGGCIANIITSILFIILCLCFPNNGYVASICVALATIGIVAALLNGIPLKLGGICNDGYNVMAQKKEPKAMRAMWTQLSANNRLMQGESLKTIPEDWLYMPDEKGLNNTIIATIGVFYANKLLVMEEFDKTIKTIDKLISEDNEVLELHKKLLICDKIFCILMTNNDSQEIDKLNNKEQIKFMKQMKKYPSVLRTQYALELIHKGNLEESKKIKATFEKVGKNYPYSGDIQDERNLMALCDEKMKSTLGNGSQIKTQE